MINTAHIRARWLTFSIIGVLLLTGCGLLSQERDSRVDAAGGDIERGRELARTHGCVACHSVTGMPSVANGYGPDLNDVASNRLIAGSVANDPDTMIEFLMNPTSVAPGTSMPNVGLTEQEARDLTSWLYSLED